MINHESRVICEKVAGANAGRPRPGDARSGEGQNIRLPDESRLPARLPNGLHIACERTRDDRCPHGRQLCRFRLGREQVYPSFDEVASSRIAFHVPADATERRFVLCRAHPKSGRRIRYHIVEFGWTELDETSHD